MTQIPATPGSTKRSPVSLRFLLVALAIIVGGYFAGLKAMEFVMLQQERAKATGEAIAPAKFEQRPEGLSLGSGGN